MEKFEKKERKFSKRRDDDAGSAGGKDGGDKKGSWRRRERPAVDLIIDYKDVDSLKPFLSEGGRIVPSRVNRMNRKQQRELASQVKRARQLALVAISDRHGNQR